jgi:para-nitrobenzyl esterase
MSIVQTVIRQGIVEGLPLAGYTLFKGIPYAKPPVDQLRFKAPRPPESWEGVRKAHAFAAKPLNTGISRVPSLKGNFTAIRIFTAHERG